MAARASETAVTVLELIAAGRTYEQILAAHPRLTYLDIFNAAREALTIIGEAPRTYQQMVAEKRRRYPRAYEAWQADEDATLAQLVDRGETVDSISELLQRQPSAIRSRIVRLSLTTSVVSSQDQPITGSLSVKR